MTERVDLSSQRHRTTVLHPAERIGRSLPFSVVGNDPGAAAAPFFVTLGHNSVLTGQHVSSLRAPGDVAFSAQPSPAAALLSTFIPGRERGARGKGSAHFVQELVRSHDETADASCASIAHFR